MENQQKNVTRILILMAIMQFTNAMDFMIIMPLSVHLIPKFHINSSQFSMLVAIYAFSAFASSVSASFYADKFERKKVLLAAYVGLVACTLFCGLANSFSTMLLARCFTGIFGGLIGAQTLAIAGDIVPFERRGKAVGILMSGFSLEVVVNFIDLVQKDKFRGDSSVKTFLFSLNRFTWLNELKRSGRPLAREEKYEKGQERLELDTSHFIAEREGKAEVLRLVSELGETCRKILLLFYYENLSMKDTLEATDYENEQVVRNKKYKCLKQLEQMINEKPFLKQTLKNLLHG